MSGVEGRHAHAHPWVTVARTFGKADSRRSALQLVTTVLPLAAIWTMMALNQNYGVGYWATLLLAVPAAGLLVRLFMIQHDCGHGSFFRARWLNDMVGRVIGVFTLTPYDQWRSAHAYHHATSGDLTRRGIGDVSMLTISEYRALSRWQRFLYRLYRNPLVLFGIGPIYLFVIKHRFPFRSRPDGKRGVASVLATNAAIAALVGVAMYFFGAADLLMVQIPITVIASSMGVWLFFVQHQFEHTYWERHGEWSFQDAAVRGSSYYDLPMVLRWFTADIGIHHVHHLCSKIPNYRLRECVDAHPELADVKKLTLLESLKCMRLALWDEQRKRLVRFRDAGDERVHP